MSVKVKNLIAAISVIVLIVLLSIMSSKFQGHKDEGGEKKPLILNDTMTIGQFGIVNSIPDQTLKETLKLTNKSDLKKKISATGFSNDQITELFQKQLTLKAEYESRNWIKIPVKFGLTIALLITAFILLRKGKVTTRVRVILLSISILIFGVLFGPDPNPMGTVKDAIVLFGTKHVIFPPRMVAFTLFLLMVILANKFICSWACQFGTLQDLLFRIGGGKGNNVSPQFKLPFLFTNTIRIIFFIVLSTVALIATIDIIGPIDPFKVFNPVKLGIAGGIFTGVVLILSIFVYRPWCHLFCPFGLVGWLAEKISLYKIKVNYTTCIACKKCSAACPSTVMKAILERDKVIPDCFSCGACIKACPTKSVTFDKGRRSRPPKDKFQLTKQT